MASGKLYNGDCLKVLKILEPNSIDLTVTSPPYDNLRTYNGQKPFTFEDFQVVAQQLFRVTKKGGVVVWVVGDATIKGSETGTSFKQALYFKEVGFNLHDTMIYQKENYTPLTHKRYEQEWEYMFVFIKEKIIKFNAIKIPCKYAGQETWGSPSQYKDNSGKLTVLGKKKINSHKQKGNIWAYRTGSTQTGKINHPAMFPEQLANDHIISWSNPGDTILDPFLGSGTTGKMAKLNGRSFIGIEKDPEYYQIAKNRISNAVVQNGNIDTKTP
jgi:site-specific DNA-methyltransferase (adenine-specific)